MAAKVGGTWKVSDRIGVEDLTTIGTAKLWPLGTKIKAVDTGTTAYGPGEFIYLEGVASVVRGDICTFNDDYLTARLVARAKGAVGVALAACVASNYGWFQILGRGVASSNTTIVDGTQAYACGTTGIIDDAIVAGDFITGMIISSTTDTATCVVNMTCYPVMVDADNA